jgi:hypothetical protein
MGLNPAFGEITEIMRQPGSSRSINGFEASYPGFNPEEAGSSFGSQIILQFTLIAQIYLKIYLFSQILEPGIPFPPELGSDSFEAKGATGEKRY